MTIQEDLVYFLRNGKFENINFGITRLQLNDLIGEPDFTLPEKSKTPTLFEYDNIEFYFEDKSEDARLKTIQIDYPIKYSKKGRLIFNSHRWAIKLTIEQAIKFMQTHKIGFEEKPDSLNLDFWRLLETESGVQIHFTNQRDENVWELHKFGKSIEFESRKNS